MGHIFGVESPLMVEKLEQYNRVIEVNSPPLCESWRGSDKFVGGILLTNSVRITCFQIAKLTQDAE